MFVQVRLQHKPLHTMATTDFWTSRRSVAPLISIVLLVAIAVVIGSVVSVLALDIGADVDEPAPQAAMETEQTNGTVTFTHHNGEPIDPANLKAVGGDIDNASLPSDEIQAGDSIAVEPDDDAEEVAIAWKEGGQSATLARTPVTSGSGSSTSGGVLVEETAADTYIPVTEYGTESKEQYDALEAANLSDPFTLSVKAPELAGETSNKYAVTAYYGDFGAAPNDRLAGPSTPLAFDENGVATVTIGSAGTNADETTWIAPGSVSNDASLINNIELPAETERVAIETTDD